MNKGELKKIKNRLEGKLESEDIKDEILSYVAKLTKFFEEQLERNNQNSKDILASFTSDSKGELEEKLNEHLKKESERLLRSMNQEISSILEVEIYSIKGLINEYVDGKLEKDKELVSKKFSDLGEKIEQMIVDFSGKHKRIENIIELSIVNQVSGIDKRINDIESKSKSDSDALKLLSNSLLERIKTIEDIKPQVYEYGANLLLRVDSVDRGYIQGLNLIAGSGVSISVSQSLNTFADVTISAGGFTPKNPTLGNVDGTNTVFTFDSEPSVICVDQGRFMQKVSSDGTVNWTGTTTIILSVAPTFDIFSL